MLGLSTRKWGVLREALIEAGLICTSGDHIKNERADRELEATGAYRERQRLRRKGKGAKRADRAQSVDDAEKRALNNTVDCVEDWLDEHDRIEEWMDRDDVFAAMLRRGHTVERLRDVGFTSRNVVGF